MRRTDTPERQGVPQVRHPVSQIKVRISQEERPRLVFAARALGETLEQYLVRSGLLRAELLRLVLSRRGNVRPCPLWDELPPQQLAQHVRDCPACGAASTAVEDRELWRDVPEDWMRAWEMRLGGATERQIARIFGVAHQSVHYWIRKTREALLPWLKAR